MATNSKPLLFRVAGELAVIVIGVLIAFQVENMREANESAQRETAALVAIRADLQETLRRIGRDIERHSRSIEAQQQLLRISERPQSTLSPDSMTALVTEAILYQRLEPVTGSYDAMVASGDLRLIRNSGLRGNLASLFGAMGNGYEDEELSTALRTELIMSVAEGSDLLRVAGKSWRQRAAVGQRVRSSNVESLLHNPRYVTALMALCMAEMYQRDYFRRVQSQIESVSTQIHAELAK